MLDDRQRALATVDLSAVRHNIAHLVSLLPVGTSLCAVVKANGYGHGAVPVARAALQAGASWLGIATVAEAEELREAAIAAPLLIFGPMTGGFWYTEAELMKTYWATLPRKRARSRSMSSGVKAIQSTTTSNSMPASAARTSSGRLTSAIRRCAPGSSAACSPRPCCASAARPGAIFCA